VIMMLWDAFEVIILPRRVTPRFRFARFFYRLTWQLRSVVAEWITGDKGREFYLSTFGPLSLLLLLGVWATGIVADSWQISYWQTPILSIATENSAIQETSGKRVAEG
jgi:hypothetical protein